MAIKPSVAVLPSIVSPLCSSHYISHCTRSSSSPLCKQFKQQYATVQEAGGRKWSDCKSSADDALHEWPKSPRPTPYEVLGVSKGALYDKRRFYRLVKLYHPDTHGHHRHRASSSSPFSKVKNLPHATRLERYRMIVAANELLSNPSKRRMYDQYGVGWSHGRATSLRDIDRTWRYQEGTAANNATWEDWERWREAQEGKSSEPVYMSHGAFATIVVILCLFAAMGQTSRAGASGAHYVKWVAEHSSEIGSRLRASGTAVAGLNRDERVDYFLRERENANFLFEPSKYEETTDHPRPSP